MKNYIYCLCGSLLLLISSLSYACNSYDSFFPPPYPQSYPCMSDFLADPANSFCCDVEFDAYCVFALRIHCDEDNATSIDNYNAGGQSQIDAIIALDYDCRFERCTITGCDTNYPTMPPFGIPYCNENDPLNSVAPAYSSDNPPPGNNPPVETFNGEIYRQVNTTLTTLFAFDGQCFSEEWAPICWGSLDSLTCFYCTDNDPSTVDGVHPSLGCTYTPISPISPGALGKFKVFLQGPYIGGGMMSTTLRSNNLLPATQPFNTAPWNYNGTEGVASPSDLPANAVDWVLIELRSPLNYNLTVGYGAGILLNDGRVVNADYDITNLDGIAMGGVQPGTNYYVIIRSRNHLDVMSATPIFLSSSQYYDFTVGFPGAAPLLPWSNVKGDYSLQYLHNEQFGLYAGDINGDGAINTNDFTDTNAFYNEIPMMMQYTNSDLNMDGFVTYADFNLYVYSDFDTTDGIPQDPIIFYNKGQEAVGPVLITGNPVSPLPNCN